MHTAQSGSLAHQARPYTHNAKRALNSCSASLPLRTTMNEATNALKSRCRFRVYGGDRNSTMVVSIYGLEPRVKTFKLTTLVGKSPKISTYQLPDYSLTWSEASSHKQN